MNLSRQVKKGLCFLFSAGLMTLFQTDVLGQQLCSGGTNNGVPCVTDEDCPGMCNSLVPTSCTAANDPCPSLRSNDQPGTCSQSGETCLTYLECPTQEFCDNPYATCSRPAAGVCVGLPIELQAFSGSNSGPQKVSLEWLTASESNNAGFEVQHRVADGFYETVAFVEGQGSTRVAHTYRYTASGLDPGSHVFRLNQIDFDGSSWASPEVEVVVSVPDRYLIEPAYPNPFNPVTTIRFAVAADQEVSATLHSVLGTRVRQLATHSVAANEMQTLRVDGSGLPTGMYIVRIAGTAFSASQRVILMK